MASDTFLFIQASLLYVFTPIISWWLAALVMLGVVAALYQLMLALYRWLSGKHTLI